MPSRWRVVYPSAFAQAWDCPGKCNSPGLHWYTAGVGRVVWRVGCGAGCAFVPRIYAHACHPPRPAGVAWGCVVCAGCAWCGVRCAGVAWCVPVYMHTAVTPPRCGGVWRGCRVRCGAVVGCCRIYAHGCHPPPEKGIKRAGRPCCRPAFVGCAYFWLLFMPPRLRMVASVSAISSGVYPAAANTAPSLSSSTAFVSIQ